MSVRGLPKGQLRSGSGVVLPDYGTVEWVNSTGDWNRSITVSSMKSDEFAIIMGGYSAYNTYIYNIGYNETDVEAKTLDVAINSSGLMFHLAMVRPMPHTAETHGTSINWSLGDSGSDHWVRVTFRGTPGFRGHMVRSQRVNGAAATNRSWTPPTNPMDTPGGVCIMAVMKDWTDGPTGVTGTGWSAGGWYPLGLIAYYPLSTTEIETPGSVTTTGGSNSYTWAASFVYLR